MAISREGSDEPGRPLAGPRDLRQGHGARRLGSGTLACPDCDAPLALDRANGPVAVTTPVRCPYCARDGRLRDFLSLAAPARPTRVAVTVRAPALATRRVR